MTAQSIIAAIDDARALLDALLSSNWQEAHIVSADTEIFIARAGGKLNPLQQKPIVGAQSDTADEPLIDVTAPHVATLVSTATNGSRVATGQVIATIRVLGDEKTIVSPCEGVIEKSQAVEGALLEFGTPILTLRGAA